MQELGVVCLHLLLLEEKVMYNNIDRSAAFTHGNVVLTEYPTFSLYQGTPLVHTRIAETVVWVWCFYFVMLYSRRCRHS